MNRILIVEDDSDAGQVLAELLRAYGHDVSIARSGKDAWSLVEHELFDAVLLDLGLPDLSGADVCRGLIDRRPQLAVVALSGWSGARDRNLALDAGCIDFLVKPVAVRKIVDLLERILPRPG